MRSMWPDLWIKAGILTAEGNPTGEWLAGALLLTLSLLLTIGHTSTPFYDVGANVTLSRQ